MHRLPFTKVQLIIASDSEEVNCHYCRKAILIGDYTVSKAGGTHRNYYHYGCANKLNLL